MPKRDEWDVDEAAARFRVQPNTVRDWIRRGLPVTTKGSKGAGNKSLIDPIAALPWFLDYIAADAERIRLSKEQADKVALENAERRGDLTRVSVMEKAFADAVATAQALLLAIPTKEAPMLAPLTDANAIENRLRNAINDALRQLAAYGSRGVGERQRGRRAGNGAVRAAAGSKRKRVGGGKPTTQ